MTLNVYAKGAENSPGILCLFFVGYFTFSENCVIMRVERVGKSYSERKG